MVKGVFLGGFEDAKEEVKSGRLPAEDFQMISRYSGWGPGQLAKECVAGVWFPAAAGSALILDQVKH